MLRIHVRTFAIRGLAAGFERRATRMPCNPASSPHLLCRVPSELEATATWLRAACGSEDAFDRSTHHIMSDSPGLLRFIRRRQKGRIQAGGVQGSVDATASTRSWLQKDPKAARMAREAALDALSIAASSSSLFVAPQQAFIDDYYCGATQPVCQHGTLRPSDNRAGVAGIHDGSRKGP